MAAADPVAALSGPDRVAVIRAAAEAGLAEAQAVYGQMLLDGREVAAAPPAAFRWFLAAARQEHLDAVNMVGRCYDQGWGVAVDKAAAAGWFRAAAARGLDWGMYNYATLLALGEGVAEDRGEALRWLRRAAALGNAKAENFLGSFYEDGWAVAPSLAQAAVHYARAADGGDFRGCFNHARMRIAAGAIDEAIGWLERAADAPARFRGQAAAWLAARPEPALRRAAGLFAA